MDKCFIIGFTLLFNRYQIISKKGHIERLRCNSHVYNSPLSFIFGIDRVFYFKQHSELEHYDVTVVLQASYQTIFLQLSIELIDYSV